MSYIKNKRDANEAEIVEYLRFVGCVIIQMSKDAGFDMVVTRGSRNHIVEIKNPAVKWKLTDAEKSRKAEIEYAGGRYWVIETVDQAAKMLGL